MVSLCAIIESYFFLAGFFAAGFAGFFSGFSTAEAAFFCTDLMPFLQAAKVL